MYIVWFAGGLGNQLFQYSFYKFLEKKEKEVFADLNWFKRNNIHNGYELQKIFKIELKKAMEEDILSLKGKIEGVSRKINRRIGLYKFKTYKTERKKYNLDNEILYYDNLYLEGYWQSISYIVPIENELRKKFIFKPFIDDKNKKLVKDLEKNNSVSIHIRRGDYIKKRRHRKLYNNICDLKYYKNAINIIRKKINNPVFYIFTNDMDWVKENIKGENFNYVDWNRGDNSFRDMQLMSLCKHNIIANSTFSWWGAWINNNKNKIVISPKKMINKKIDFSNAFPNDWKKIGE